MKNPAYSSIALAVFCVLSLFLYPCFLPSRSYADTPEVTPSITIGSSGTLAFSLDPGQFNHGSQDITVLTTNYTGYTLTAVPSSNDSRLTNTATATPSYITSIASDSTSSNFSSAEYGFSTDTTITSSTTYHPVTTSTEIKRTNSATTTAQAGTFQLTIGAKAGSNTPAGTYTRTFTLTASANAVAYAVTYVENAGQDTVSNMPSPNPQTTGTVVGTTLTLDSSRPTRTGYTFLGWDTNSSATTATYNAGGSYSLDQTTSNQITLYAIWIENMQTWAGCNSMNEGASTLLADSRDGNTYTVAKLGGRCWMTQNLRITGTIPASGSNFTGSDFNVSQYDLTDSTRCATSGASSSDPKGYTNVCSHYSSGSSDTGNEPTAWYNYAAATAGTITGYSNSTNATSDICPSGWRLPTNPEQSGLISALGSDFSPFRPVYGGNYYNGSTENPSNSGNWWSSTAEGASNTQRNWIMYYDNFGSGNPGLYNYDRSRGPYIRCVQKNPTHTVTVSYSTGVASVTINGQNIANNDTVTMEEGIPLSINMTFDSDYEFDSWSATSGTLGSASTQSTTYTIGSSNATLTAKVTAPLQTWNDCNSMRTGETIELYDTRDSQTYKVSKYKMGYDGSKTACWMSNLNLGDTENYPLVATSLTSSNTHLPTDGSKDVTASNFNNWKKTIGSGSYTSKELIPVSGNDSYGNKYGTLYNFCAASAGTICTNSNLYNASYDLCPSGWRLPTGGSSGEFQAFYNAYHPTATTIKSTYGFPPAGTFGYNSAPSGQGTYGDYWSSTRYNGYYMYHLEFNSSEVRPATYLNSAYGFSVRCIKQGTTHNLTVSYGTGVAGVTIDGMTVANGATVEMEEGVAHSINMTFTSGYEFDSWSATSGTLGSASTQSTTYTIGSSDATLTANGKIIAVTFDQAYAAADKTQSGGYYKMQDMTPEICSAVTPGQTATLIDIRDGQTYTVAKWYMDTNHTLANAKCWMSSNLNLGAQSITVSKLNSANSHFPIDGSKDITSSTFMTWDRTTSGSSASYTVPKFTPITASNASNGRAEDIYGNKYGTLYNYAAASAGTYKSGGGSGTGNGSYDICPSGWRLPTAGSDGEYKQLITDGYSIANSSAGSIFAQQNLKFPLAGYWYNGAPDEQGATGNFWSTTWYDGYCMYGLRLLNQNVIPTTNYYGRDGGYSVRCIVDSASRHSLTVNYGANVAGVTIDGNVVANGESITLYDNSTHNIDMTFTAGYEFDSWSATSGTIGSTSTQSTTYTIGSSNATLTATGKVLGLCTSVATCMQTATSCDTTLTDARDGKTYTVATINNQCWMTQNLVITGTISAKYSNFTGSDFNISQYDLTNSTNCGSSTGLTNVCSHYTASDSYNNNRPNAWYNYAAATAGTITGSSNSTDASQDICPSGWRLPTNSEQSGIRSYSSAFLPVKGGYYNGTTYIDGTSYGVWWSSKASGNSNRYWLRYDGTGTGSGHLETDSNKFKRSSGLYVRCVRSS